jgi:hypothetical protein
VFSKHNPKLKILGCDGWCRATCARVKCGSQVRERHARPTMRRRHSSFGREQQEDAEQHVRRKLGEVPSLHLISSARNIHVVSGYIFHMRMFVLESESMFPYMTSRGSPRIRSAIIQRPNNPGVGSRHHAPFLSRLSLNKAQASPSQKPRLNAKKGDSSFFFSH